MGVKYVRKTTLAAKSRQRLPFPLLPAPVPRLQLTFNGPSKRFGLWGLLTVGLYGALVSVAHAAGVYWYQPQPVPQQVSGIMPLSSFYKRTHDGPVTANYNAFSAPRNQVAWQ